MHLHRHRVTTHIVGGGTAEGREGCRKLERDDVFETDAAAVAGEMQRPRAAVGEQRELGRVNALPRNHPAQRIVGIRLEHADHALGCLLDADAERIGAFLLEGLQSSVDIELHLAAEEVVGIEPSEDRIAIGDRRLGATAAETDGTRHRARTLRAERDLPRQRIDLDDHAGAGADRVEMQRRHVELEPIHDRLVLDARLPPRDDAHVERCAAHVRADEAIVADELPTYVAPRSRRSPRDHRLVQARMIDRGEATEGEQRLHAILEAVLLGDVLDALELLPAPRGCIRLDEHAVQTRLLADDGTHLVARVDEHLDLRLLRLLAHDLGDAALVGRVHMREEQADADGLDPVLEQCFCRCARLVLVERDDDVAELIDALGDTVRAPARHERIGMMVRHGMEAIGVGIVSQACRPRPMRIMSSVPLVVMRPRRRPVRDSSVLSMPVPE